MTSQHKVEEMLYRDSVPWRQDGYISAVVRARAFETSKSIVDQWAGGTREYGTSFVGDPLLNARMEIADTANYLTVMEIMQGYILECLKQAYDKLVSIAEMYNDPDPDSYMREAIPLLFQGEDGDK